MMPQALPVPGAKTTRVLYGSPSPRPPAEQDPPPDSLHTIGFYSALALVFLRFSFLHETFTYLTGVNTYVLYLFGPIALFAFFVSGGAGRVFGTRTGKAWLGFVVWMALAVPMSSWLGGSAMHLLAYLRTDFPMLLVTGGIARTWKECRKIILTIALAGLVNLATAHLFVQNVDGRISLNGEGTISNSNDLAAHLLLVLPFLLYYLLRPRTNIVIRLVLCGAIANGLFQILRTGSRGALIAIVLTCLYVLFRGSGRQKMAIAVAAPVGLVLLISFLPGSTWQRLTSFGSHDSALEEATESKEAREYLLRQSLIFTAKHPLFGVGPGQFSAYEGALMTSEGKLGNWHETHNTYTQVSAECGIPALICYLVVLFSTFSFLNQMRKRALATQNEELARTAFCLSIALVTYSCSTFFISFAYHFHLLVISGLVIAMRLALEGRWPGGDPVRTQENWRPAAVPRPPLAPA